MEYQSNLPLFYQKPIPLNSEVHAAMTIGASPGGFAFAAQAHSVVLAGVEFLEACRFFPILFGASDNGPAVPVALLGIQSGENLFVGPSGEWQAGYIPAYIRRYPFIHTEGDGAEQIVCVDEAYDGLNREGGELLFENGGPSPRLQKSLEFLNDFVLQMKTTSAFCQQLQELGLLKQMNATINLKDGRQLTLTDFQVIEESALAALDKDSIDALFRSGGLALVYAHLISLRNLAGMAGKKAAL